MNLTMPGTGNALVTECYKPLFIGKRLHMIAVENGESVNILDRKVTFLIYSQQWRNSSDFVWNLGKARN